MNVPDMSGTTTRRGFLVLGAGAAAGLVLAGSTRAAQAATVTVTVDGLQFDVPAQVQPVPAEAEVGGASWQWRGARAAAPGSAGAMVVLARSDLASSDAGEVLGLLLSGALAGGLPGLTVEGRRTRTMAEGGEQVRVDLSYDAAATTRYRGTLLVATRGREPTAALAVLGDDSLTAGEISAGLDSARWVT